MAVGTPSIGTMFEATAAAASSAVAYPAVVRAGDLLVLAGSTSGSNNTIVTTPAGFTQVAQLSPTVNTTSPNTGMWIKVADGTETGTLTVSHSSFVNSFQLLAFPGVDPTTPQDVTATTVDNAAALTTVIPAATPATTGGAIVMVGGLNLTTATATPPTGATETADRVAASARSWELSYALGTTAGVSTGTQTINWTLSAKSVGIMLILRPAYQFEVLTPTPRYY